MVRNANPTIDATGGMKEQDKTTAIISIWVYFGGFVCWELQYQASGFFDEHGPNPLW